MTRLQPAVNVTSGALAKPKSLSWSLQTEHNTSHFLSDESKPVQAYYTLITDKQELKHAFVIVVWI